MNVSSNITRLASRSLLQARKHSPLILTIAGIASLVGAGVLAARSTLKLEETLDRGNDRLEHSRATHEDGKAVTSVYVTNIVEVAKLYAAPATLVITGSVLILSGHHILHQRNAALVVAYKGLETAFSNYRDRVKEKYGDAIDEEFRYGLRTNEIVGENGKKTKELVASSSDNLGEYVFDFKDDNVNWVGQPDQNLFFLRAHQNMLNDMLRARGHVFLSEALDSLGIPRTRASIVTGWIYDPKNEIDDEPRDNWIDFGIKDLWDTNRGFRLNFNVDGTVLDKI